MHDVRASAGRLVGRARGSGLSLATVESCTAGALACALAAVPGAGEVFHGAFVVYTKANKMKAVGVSRELLRTHSAVSAPISRAMALGGLAHSPADIVIAITGVAGPEPDEDGNPVGLVYVAAAHRDGRALEEEHRLSGTKAEICAAAMMASLRLADRLIG
jgi:nicotinamide-nucleotide amidase